jgi:hypothetical protein
LTQSTDLRSLLEQAAAEMKLGHKNEAQRLLAQAVQQDPNNSSAWYGLAIVLGDETKKKDCLKRVLALKPDHERARAMLAQLDAPAAVQETVLPLPPVEPKPVVPLAVPHPATPKPIRKQAGASTREMERERRNYAKIHAMVGIVALILLSIPIVFYSKIIPFELLIGLLVIIGIIYKVLPNRVDKKLNESRRAGRGAAAEEKIGELLAELGPDFEVLHDVECAYGNIDHLVIASNGAIFMIETKSHRGKVTVQDNVLLVNGRTPEKDFIAQSLRNSFWLRDQIEPFAGKKPWVTAVLVFTNGFVQVRGPVKGVIVTNKKYLLNTIQNAVKRARALPGVWEQREEIARLLG